MASPGAPKLVSLDTEALRSLAEKQGHIVMHADGDVQDASGFSVEGGQANRVLKELWRMYQDREPAESSAAFRGRVHEMPMFKTLSTQFKVTFELVTSPDVNETTIAILSYQLDLRRRIVNKQLTDAQANELFVSALRDSTPKSVVAEEARCKELARALGLDAHQAFADAYPRWRQRLAILDRIVAWRKAGKEEKAAKMFEMACSGTVPTEGDYAREEHEAWRKKNEEARKAAQRADLEARKESPDYEVRKAARREERDMLKAEAQEAALKLTRPVAGRKVK